MMRYFIFVLLIFISVLLPGQNKAFTVVLDPGHGGHDSGAVGYGGLKEKDINLNMALIVSEMINRYSPEITVIMTRRKDVFIPLEKRSEIAVYFKPDLFLSIHCDANPNSNAQGVSVYIQLNIKSMGYSVENYEKSVKFAILLNGILKEKLGMKSRDILFNNYSVLRNTLSHMPSVLIETGFISNREEAGYYRKVGQKTIALAIYLAIKEYKQMLYGK